MAGEVDASLLPLEGLATQNGKALTYGQSGVSARLPVLTSSGGVFGHGTVAVTVPMQKIALHVIQPISGTVELTVPLQIARGYAGGQAALTVPMQVVAVAATVPIIGRAALTVPVQTVLGTGRTGSLAGAALRVPMQQLAAHGAGKSALAVPMQLLAAHGVVPISGTAALSVPIQQATGTISVTSYPGRGAVVVPMIVAGPYGRASLTVPMQHIAGTFVVPADFEAWVMNVRNGGVTRWTNFPFVQFARVDSNTFAVGNDGNLYLLGGDLDGTAPIAWEFETGLEDLGSPGIKHIPYLYMDGIIDGEIEITLIDDRNREFVYEYDTKDRGAVHQPHRRKLGNGIRTRNVAFRLRSTKGAYIELDSLEPEGTITQRSI